MHILALLARTCRRLARLRKAAASRALVVLAAAKAAPLCLLATRLYILLGESREFILYNIHVRMEAHGIFEGGEIGIGHVRS